MISTLLPAFASLVSSIAPSQAQIVGNWSCFAVDDEVQMEMDPQFYRDGTVAMDIRAEVPIDAETMGNLHMISHYKYELDGEMLVMNFTHVDFKSFLMGGKTLEEVLGAEMAADLEAVIREQLAVDMAGETRDRITQLDSTKLVFVGDQDGVTTTCTPK